MHRLESFGMERQTQYAETPRAARSNTSGGGPRTVAIKGFDWSHKTAGLNQTTPKWLKVRRNTMVSSGPLVHKGHRDGIELVSRNADVAAEEDEEDSAEEAAIKRKANRRKRLNAKVAERKALQGEETLLEAEASKHPRGWSARTSSTGQAYFQNDHTNTTTWEKPALPAPPAGWKVRPHAEQGQYYIHIASNKTQFQHPHDGDSPSSSLDDEDV